MSDFNWCHGPNCHKSHTVDRVRGVKGSKVLRTRKVKYWSGSGIYNYFCSQSCYNEFANKYIQEVIAIAPRTECLETPIKDPTKERNQYSYYSYDSWNITVDESRQS
jgi:YHS domain-containing protein